MNYIGYIIAGIIVGIAATTLIAIKLNSKKKTGKKYEFSKIVLLLVLSTYFIGVFVGIKVVFIDVTQLGVVLAFIGTPTAAAIAFYCWKAKAENILKIKKENPDITEGTINLNDISSQ